MILFKKIQIHIIFIASLLLLLSIDSLAGEMDKLFMQGNDYYQNGNYKAAIEEYLKIRKAGYESWEVYYNLGNAYYKEGQIAQAILNYERAKKLNSKNEDIIFNLELANLSVVDRIPELPSFFLFSWFSNMAHLFSMQMLGVISLSFYLVIISMLIFRIMQKSIRLKKTTFTTIMLMSILFIFFAGIFILRVYENETNVEAIVLMDKVDVKSAPAEAGTEVFTLHAGVKVQIQDRSSDWVKIKLADGKVGWLKDGAFETI